MVGLLRHPRNEVVVKFGQLTTTLANATWPDDRNHSAPKGWRWQVHPTGCALGCTVRGVGPTRNPPLPSLGCSGQGEKTWVHREYDSCRHAGKYEKHPRDLYRGDTWFVGNSCTYGSINNTTINLTGIMTRQFFVGNIVAVPRS